MKKIINFVSLNKKKIFIGLGILVLLTTIALLLIFLVFKGNGNKIVKIKNGEYADDTKTYALLQPLTEGNLKYKVYGEGINYDKKDYVIKATNMSSGSHLLNGEYDISGGVDYSAETSTKEERLISKPVEINNHAILTIGGQVDSSMPYNISKASFDKERYLNAYFELPDGSLITVSSNSSPKIQVNIYNNEIRVVIVRGSAYFRIAKQAKNKIFSVQIADKIFSTNGNTEFFAYNYGKVATKEKTKLVRDEFKKMVSNNTEFIAEVEKNDNDTAIYTGSFSLIEGYGEISNRGGDTSIPMSMDGEYIFEYLYKLGGETTREGSNIYISPSEYISAGYYEQERGIWGTEKKYYDFLDEQKQINELDLGFNEIKEGKANITEIMAKYSTYFVDQFNARLKVKLADSKKYYDETGWEYKKCSSLGYYYVSSFGACCPEGYQINLVTGSCTIYNACDDGEHINNGKCCPDGYSLINNECVGVSTNNTCDLNDIKEYNYSGIDETKTYTCVDRTSIRGQVFCPKNDTPNLGAHVSKNGQCCY